MITNILYFLWLINILIQIGYWAGIFSWFYRRKTPLATSEPPLPPLSIVVCAKNEAQNLNEYLYYILQQNYNNFELIVVNDGSTDLTAVILQNYKTKFPHLKIVTIAPESEKILAGKKHALTAGIAAAQYDWILVTDADCMPRSANWAQTMMAAAVRSSRKIVLGYSPYQVVEGSFLNTWIRLEAIYTALQYVSLAQIGLPYMGVGRNMLYQKSLFWANGGLGSHADLASGDDDLLVRDIADAANTVVCLAPSSFVDSVPKTSWSSYWQQKRRHISTSVRYKSKIQFLLGALSASQLYVYIGGALLLLIWIIKGNTEIWGVKYAFTFFLGLFILRWLLQIAQLWRVKRILNEQISLLNCIIFDISLFIYLVILSGSFFLRAKVW